MRFPFLIWVGLILLATAGLLTAGRRMVDRNRPADPWETDDD